MTLLRSDQIGQADQSPSRAILGSHHPSSFARSASASMTRRCAPVALECSQTMDVIFALMISCPPSLSPRQVRFANAQSKWSSIDTARDKVWGDNLAYNACRRAGKAA